ncbi:hypothetical protein ACQPZP_09835 [Spirillospora sp. CA-142024]|uniref:hypothetical protein n=1 Tax=Spirillospora sp. CA-142024 TaxID=3240036 RepID=UPI003D8D0CE2
MATVISYRGHGWLSPLILFGAPLPLVGVLSLTGLPAVVAAVPCFLAGAAVNHLVGVRLNSTVTPRGRVFHNRHEFMGAPMQNTTWFVGGLFFLAAGAVVAGMAGEAAGHLFFYLAVGTGLAVWVVVKIRRGRVHPLHLSGEAALAGGRMKAMVDGRAVTFEVPAKVRSGALVRAPGQGRNGTDLHLRVIVRG